MRERDVSQEEDAILSILETAHVDGDVADEVMRRVGALCDRLDTAINGEPSAVETNDGEIAKAATRALADGLGAFRIQAVDLRADETCEQLVKGWHAAVGAMETHNMDAKLAAQRRVVQCEQQLHSWAARHSLKANDCPICERPLEEHRFPCSAQNGND